LRLKILKKLRTASLNSEFTGSYKKSVINFHNTVVCFKLSLAVLFFNNTKLCSQGGLSSAGILRTQGILQMQTSTIFVLKTLNFTGVSAQTKGGRD